MLAGSSSFQGPNRPSERISPGGSVLLNRAWNVIGVALPHVIEGQMIDSEDEPVLVRLLA